MAIFCARYARSGRPIQPPARRKGPGRALDAVVHRPRSAACWPCVWCLPSLESECIVTHMMSERTLSTAEARREKVIDSAIVTFARGGYHSTTIARVADNAGISPAYVSKLF